MHFIVYMHSLMLLAMFYLLLRSWFVPFLTIIFFLRHYYVKPTYYSSMPLALTWLWLWRYANALDFAILIHVDLGYD